MGFYVLLVFALPFIYFWNNKMKLILFLAVVAALFWHSEINEFINGPAKPLTAEQQARVEAQKGVIGQVGAPHSNSPAVLPMPAPAASAAAPVVISKEADAGITQWIIDHTPKK